MTDSTSSPTAITLTGCGRSNGEGGIILDVIMVDSANQSTAGSFELWLFSATVTPDNDNAVFTPTDAECATLVAVIPLNVSYVGDATSGAGGNRVYQSDQANRHFVCAAGDANLYGLLVVRNAYTPVSGETFTIILKIDNLPVRRY